MTEAVNEFCLHCGESVVFGSGRFVNRVPSFDTQAERLEAGFNFPLADFVCPECIAEGEKLADDCRP